MRLAARLQVGLAARALLLELALLCPPPLALGCGAPQSAHAADEPLLIGPDAEPKKATPRAVGRTRAVTAREMRAIQPLFDAAERVRGLRFAHAVPVLVQDADAIMGYVDSQIKQDELDRSRTIYVALGLLADDLDVRKLLLRLMGEQVVGYYDVEAHHLVVREDVMRAFGGGEGKPGVDLAEARVVLVHELVHALQDQRLGLSANIDRKRDSDGENAFRALIEGDATLAMIAFALEREAVPLAELTRNPTRVRNLSELVRGSPLTGSELGSAPPIVRVPLLSAYVDGLTFVANLHGDGGWGRVDRTHADPPASTEQVIHPELFAHRDPPEPIRLPGARDALGKGKELLFEDSLGELETSVYFGLGSNDADAQRAAAGWGGDRVYAYRTPETATAVVWLSSWDGEADAIEAEQAAIRSLEAVRSVDHAPPLVERSGRALLLLRGVPSELHASLRQRFARVASGLAANRRANSGVGQNQTD